MSPQGRPPAAGGISWGEAGVCFPENCCSHDIDQQGKLEHNSPTMLDWQVILNASVGISGLCLSLACRCGAGCLFVLGVCSFWVPWCWLLFLLPWRVAPIPVLPVSLEDRSCSCVPVALEGRSCPRASGFPGGPPLFLFRVSWRTAPAPLQSGRTASALSVSGHVREASVLRRTPEPSPVQEDCSCLRTHRCSEFPAVQGDCVWFGDSPMDLGRVDAASRSPCGPGGLSLLMCAPLPCK
ncbi:hypothetical protein D4764_22G0004310 [Takifugu flavidus]|uniref:Uncharacterized protein n=1 Tax=Takifugu flavidus TaxID=433684 RepID=A0A5C6NBI3_9TELE|nr:hypothetical protein D4764_22G0004310 [Takifugu flavidus]